MTDARWIDVEADITKAVDHFQTAVELFEEGGLDQPTRDGRWNGLAFFHAMQSAYTATEQALVGMLAMIREKPPVGPDWHKKLLSRLASPMEGDLARPALLSSGIARDLDEALRFRHVAMHVYDPLDVERAMPAYHAAKRLVVALPESMSAFKAVIDPD